MNLILSHSRSLLLRPLLALVFALVVAGWSTHASAAGAELCPMMAMHAASMDDCPHDMSDGHDCQMTHSCIALPQADYIAGETQFIGQLGALAIGQQRLRPEGLYRPPKR